VIAAALLVAALAAPIDRAELETLLIDGLVAYDRFAAARARLAAQDSGEEGDREEARRLLRRLDLEATLDPDGAAAAPLVARLDRLALRSCEPAIAHGLAAHAAWLAGDVESALARGEAAWRAAPDDAITAVVHASRLRQAGRLASRAAGAAGAVTVLDDLHLRRDGRAVPLWLLVDAARLALDPALAIERLEGYAADPGLRSEGLVWATGLACEIEARDRGDPHAARARAVELVARLDGAIASPSLRRRAAELAAWYMRSADESEDRDRRRATLLAWLAAAVLVPLAAAALAAGVALAGPSGACIRIG
jgi:hypothetical protein